MIADTETQDEIPKLRDQLNSNYPKERKIAAKRVIALMRAGTDKVQDLFSDMLRCVMTEDIELKKLVYLYLVNYSSQEPEQAIMAVNAFVQDSQVDNPVVRALAVRTMCRIKLDSVAEHMILPLKKCLQDEDPYVRKTAAFGVSKLYDVIPEGVESAGLFDDLLKLLNDENPMVVANTTAAALEINSHKTVPILTFTPETLNPILAAITSCSDWCQVMLLDALGAYKPISEEDASFLVDRLIPLLKSANPAVVVGAFKCIFLFMDYDKRKPQQIFPQVIPPFITLVASAEPEIQYVVLRTLSLFVHKYPKALAKEIRVFFCKYNDPSYVKMEKLDIIVTICTPQSAQLVLDELNEYCNSVDVAFVKKSIECVGQIAMKIEAAAPRCVDILVSLVDGKADYAIEESVVVVSDILRRYPGVFEAVIAAVCKNFFMIKDPHAKAAAVWILGEYCKIIEGVDILLDPFLDMFHDEQPEVQLQILTALVKVYIEKPDETRDQLQYALMEAVKGDVTPDVRNRAYVYWRLLSTDESIPPLVVKFDKGAVIHSGRKYDDVVLNELIKNMGSVAGVLHVVPSDFVKRVTYESVDDDDSTSENRQWTAVTLSNTGIVEMMADFDPSTLRLKITNKTGSDLTDFAVAVNVNPVGLTVAGSPIMPGSIPAGGCEEVEIPIVFTQQKMGEFASPRMDIALKTSAGPVMGGVPIPAAAATMVDGRLERDQFTQIWSSPAPRSSIQYPQSVLASDEVLRDRNVFVVGRSNNSTFFSLKLQPGVQVVGEAVEDDNGLLFSFKVADPLQEAYLKNAGCLLLSVTESL